MYQIHCDGLYGSENDLNSAIEVAINYFNGGHPGEIDATVTVVAPSGKVVASLSPLPIIGTFTKQRWYGRKSDYLEDVESVEFDGTNHILRMPLNCILALEDHRENTDEVGRDHVSWDGPCAVSITAEVCHYFGVHELNEITQENLDFARARMKPEAKTVHDLTLTVRVRATALGQIDIPELMNALNISITADRHDVVLGSPMIER